MDKKQYTELMQAKLKEQEAEIERLTNLLQEMHLDLLAIKASREFLVDTFVCH